MNTTLRALILIGIAAAGFAAWIFRYEPINQGLVWDRWEHRRCSVDWNNDIHCTRDE